jgi:hypothetical protein
MPGNNTLSRCSGDCGDSDDLFLNNSITLAEDEWTSLAKNNTSNKKRAAIDTAHTKCGTPSIGFAQRGCNAAYSLGSAFNRALKKINKNKHVRFATSNKVHKYTCNEQPIMITYNSGADGHYISKKDQRKAGLPILRPSTQKVGVANGGTSMQNMSANSRSDNSPLNQGRQTHSKTSLIL